MKVAYVIVDNARDGTYHITFKKPPDGHMPGIDFHKRTWRSPFFSDPRPFGEYSRWAENMKSGTVLGVFDVNDESNLKKLSEVKFNATHRITPHPEINLDRRS